MIDDTLRELALRYAQKRVSYDKRPTVAKTLIIEVTEPEHKSDLPATPGWEGTARYTACLQAEQLFRGPTK